MKKVLIVTLSAMFLLSACSNNKEDKSAKSEDKSSETKEDSRITDLDYKIKKLLHETRMTEIKVNGNLYDDDVRTKEEMKKTSTAIFDETKQAEKDYKNDEEYKNLKKLALEDDLTNKEIIDFTEKYLDKIRSYNIPS